MSDWMIVQSIIPFVLTGLLAESHLIIYNPLFPIAGDDCHGRNSRGFERSLFDSKEMIRLQVLLRRA